MNQVFDINRTIQFAKLRLNLNRNIFIYSVAGYFALLFLIGTITSYHLDPGEEKVMNIMHHVFFIILLYGGAVFFGGRSYIAMNSASKSIEQLMVPVSTFEKFIVPFSFTSFGWIISSAIAYQLFALITNAFWGAIFRIDLITYNIFELVQDPIWFQALKHFFLIHACFFLGAAAFRKYAIPKTLLASFIIQNGLGVILTIFALFIFGNFFNIGLSIDAMMRRPEIKEWFDEGGMYVLESLYYWIITILLPIALYIIAFFKLKEREA